MVVKRDDEELTSENIIHKIKFISNIGSLLKTKYAQSKIFNNEKNQLEKEQNGIGIFIENISPIKFQISPAIWIEGSDFEEFITSIL